MSIFSDYRTWRNRNQPTYALIVIVLAVLLVAAAVYGGWRAYVAYEQLTPEQKAKILLQDKMTSIKQAEENDILGYYLEGLDEEQYYLVVEISKDNIIVVSDGLVTFSTTVKELAERVNHPHTYNRLRDWGGGYPHAAAEVLERFASRVRHAE